MQGPRIESLTNGVPNLVDLGGIYMYIYIFNIFPHESHNVSGVQSLHLSLPWWSSS